MQHQQQQTSNRKIYNNIHIHIYQKQNNKSKTNSTYIAYMREKHRLCFIWNYFDIILP